MSASVTAPARRPLVGAADAPVLVVDRIERIDIHNGDMWLVLATDQPAGDGRGQDAELHVDARVRLVKQDPEEIVCLIRMALMRARANGNH